MGDPEEDRSNESNEEFCLSSIQEVVNHLSKVRDESPRGAATRVLAIAITELQGGLLWLAHYCDTVKAGGDPSP